MISVMQGLFVGKWNESFPRTILTIFRASRNFNDRPGFTNWCSSYWHAYCISGNSFAARSAPQNPPNWAKPPATRATQTGSASATCRAVALPNERQKLKHYMEVSRSSTTADYFLLCSGRISCNTLKTRRQTKSSSQLWESMRLLRKSIGYATLGVGLAGVTVSLMYGPEELKRKVTSNGLVRVARAARTVSAYV